MHNIHKQNLLSIQKLNISFDNKRIVRDLSFSIKSGEIFCLVGESGSGKSLTALSILKLLPEHAKYEAQKLYFKDKNILTLNEKSMCSLRGSEISMIFQEPMTSLNPVIRISDQVMEAITIHNKLPKKETHAMCVDLFKSVGIAPERMDDYPHQLSGGMRQRIMIAMALACSPKLLIADEPTTALDVTIQGQILKLLKKLVKERDMGLLLITHDLGVVSEIADTVGVMYAGEIMELASVQDFFSKPLHPYAKALMACMPSATKKERLYSIAGSMPNFHDSPNSQNIMKTQGEGSFRQSSFLQCSFLTRCSEVVEQCDAPPKLYNFVNSKVRCQLYKPKN